MNRWKLALALPAALLVAACGSSNLIVVDPVKAAVRTDAVTLSYENSTVGVPDDAVARTKGYMEEAFYGGKAPAFRNVPGGVTIRYGYIGYKAGSRLGRYLVGPLGGGKAKFVLRAEFYDAGGQKIGQAQSEAELSGGFFGGSANSAIKKAVEEIQRYAVAQIK